MIFKNIDIGIPVIRIYKNYTKDLAIETIVVYINALCRDSFSRGYDRIQKITCSPELYDLLSPLPSNQFWGNIKFGANPIRRHGYLKRGHAVITLEKRDPSGWSDCQIDEIEFKIAAI